MKTKLTFAKAMIPGILAAFILVPCLKNVQAERNTGWTGQNSAEWNDPQNWTNGVPTSKTDVIIPGSGIFYFPLIITNDAVCRNLWISHGASLKMFNQKALRIHGDWINAGVFHSGDGKVVFAGSTAMVCDQLTLNDVEIEGTLVAPEGQLEVAGNFINNGTFHHNEGTINFIGNTALGGRSATEFRNLMINGALMANGADISVSGNWSNWGIFNPGTSTVSLSGQEKQSIRGASFFYNLCIDNLLAEVGIEESQLVANEFSASTVQNYLVADLRQEQHAAFSGLVAENRR